MIKKPITTLILLITLGCSPSYQKIKETPGKIMGNILKIKKYNPFAKKNKPQLVTTNETNKENISLEKPKIEHEEFHYDQELFVEFHDDEFNSIIKKKMIKSKKTSPLKLNLEDQSLVRQPFEGQEEDIINRKATLQLDFEAKSDFIIYFKSNFADVNYQPESPGRKLDIDFNKEVENISIGVTIDF